MKQFAVLTLLIVLTCGCSSKTEEKRAITEIEKLGGFVEIDKKTGKPIQVVFHGTQISDAGLVHLKGLTNIQMLDLQDTKISDAGLVHLEGLTKLDWLWLSDTKVTDAGLVHLKALTKLRFLDLRATKVTAAGVKKLQAALPDCRIIR